MAKVSLEGKSFFMNDLKIKIASNWPFGSEFDGVIGFAYNTSNPMIRYLSSRYMKEVVTISSYSQKLILGSFDLKELSEGSISWAPLTSNGWAAGLAKVSFHTSSDYSFESYSLDFSNQWLSLPRTIYQSYIKAYAYKIGCNTSNEYHINCSRVKSADYINRPSLNMVLGEKSISIPFDSFVSYLAMFNETKNNVTKTYYNFDLNVYVTDDKIIRMPFWEIYDNYVVAFDFTRGMVGIANFKYSMMPLVIVMIIVVIFVIIICYTKAKPHAN